MNRGLIGKYLFAVLAVATASVTRAQEQTQSGVELMTPPPAQEAVQSPDSASSGTPSLQRRGTITPVDIDTEKPQQTVMHYYDKHGNPLPEPVRFVIETDTVTRPKASSPYPLFNGFNIGVNFADAIMLAAGQKHAGFDVSADVSLHNWFFPTVEVGLGYAKSTPETGNYTYTGKLSPYFKIGCNYNFMYKSNPDYNVFLGLRAGFTPYTYDITDVTVNSGYWEESKHYDILNQKAFTIYGEALAGLKVKLWKYIAMGWTIRYHFKLHTSHKVKIGDGKAGSDPWYIPGYGTTSPIGFTFSLIFSMPGRKQKISDEARVSVE